MRKVCGSIGNQASETRNRAVELRIDLVRKERVFTPTPKSAFLSGTCVKCGTENTFYSNATRDVKCKQCGEVLAHATGGRVEITESLGAEIKRLDYA
jgi:ribosomal protein S27E